MSPAEVSYCFIVIVLAYTLRGGTGFGAAIAMPLLALVLPMKTLVPAWSVLSVVAGLDILRRDYDKIAWADLMPLIPSCLLGIVLGLAFYKLLDSPTLTRGLGLLVVLYGVFHCGLIGIYLGNRLFREMRFRRLVSLRCWRSRGRWNGPGT